MQLATTSIRHRFRHGSIVLLVGLFFCLPAAAQEQTWKINIKNGDINEFVAQVAKITEKTFVIDPRMKGNVTVISTASLNREAIYALFLSVLRVHNFTATESGHVVRIQQQATGKQTPGASGDLEKVPPEELVTRVIGAQNVESTELVKILRPLIPQYGHIAAVAEPNVVIVSDHADNILRLMRIIEQIDIADEEEIVVVNLKEAWVGTVVAILEKVAPDQLGRGAKGPQRIQLIANERNNSLVVKGKPRPIAEVLKLVDKLDQPATTTGSTQVLYLKHADSVKIAEILNGLVGGPERGDDSAQPLNIQPDESLNAIVVRADPGTMNEIIDIVQKLDVRRSQVLIEAAIVEILLDDSKSLGVELAAADARGSTTPLVSTSLNGAIGALLGSLITDTGDVDLIGAVGSATQPTLAAAKIDAQGLSFGAIITAISTNTSANLLSTPSILTLDNEEAKIVVGQEVPFRTGSFTTSTNGADNPFQTIQREDVGLQLTVTPHVHDGTSVRLEVSQDVENIVESAAIGEGGFSDIVTSKRNLQTTVLADDGQTIVLGGLIQDNVTDNVRKVPLLGDIPLLGHLFRSDSVTRRKNHLLVFLRPTVVRNEEDANVATRRKYEDVWEVVIESRDAQSELPTQDKIERLFQGQR